MRQWYETEQDLDNERDVIEQVAKRWGVVAKKLPRAYPFDYALCDYIEGVNYNERYPIRALVEIKNRNYPSNRFKTAVVGLDKVLEAFRIIQSSECMVLLVYAFTDEICYYEFGKEKLHTTMGGRQDRGDWQDHNPVAHIPIDKFKPL